MSGGKSPFARGRQDGLCVQRKSGSAKPAECRVLAPDYFFREARKSRFTDGEKRKATKIVTRLEGSQVVGTPDAFGLRIRIEDDGAL